MAEKAARNVGAKRAVASEPKIRDRDWEDQCRRETQKNQNEKAKLVINRKSGDQECFFVLQTLRVIGQV